MYRLPHHREFHPVWKHGRTGGDGGAIHAAGPLSILNSTIADNVAKYYGGGVSASGDTEIRNTTFTRNAAGDRYDGSGGAISFEGTLTMEDSTVSDNTSTKNGGGIYGGGVLSLANCTVAGNTAGSSGGGVALYSGTAALTNAVLSGNHAERNGGGMSVSRSETTVTNTVLIANSARNGGGIYSISSSDEGSLTLSNCTLTANAATDSGGGLYATESNEVAVNNTIIAGNTAQISDPDISSHYSDDYIPSGSHNLIGNGDSQYVFTNGRNGNLVGTPASPINPLFVRAPSDGGDGWGDDPDTTEVDESANDDYGDLRLAAGSPAIDHGSRAGLPADELDLDGDGDIAEPVPVDLAGEERVQSVQVDIGAYEYVVDPDLGGDGMVGSAELDTVRGNWAAKVTPGDRSQGDFSGGRCRRFDRPGHRPDELRQSGRRECG